MIDRAGILMDNGARIACHRVEGMNDNMSHSHYHTYFELYFLEDEVLSSAFTPPPFRLKPREEKRS